MTETNIQPKAIEVFEKELGAIQDATLQGFFYNALAVAPQSFHDDEELLTNTRKAFYILKGLLEQRNVTGAVKDALIGTALLCDILANEFQGDQAPLHTVAVRSYLKAREVDKDIQQPLFENIIRAIEAHEGPNTVSPILEAKPGTAEYEVASAFSIARLGFIEINLDSIGE